jgi:hypothetical protein
MLFLPESFDLCLSKHSDVIFPLLSIAKTTLLFSTNTNVQLMLHQKKTKNNAFNMYFAYFAYEIVEVHVVHSRRPSPTFTRLHSHFLQYFT